MCKILKIKLHIVHSYWQALRPPSLETCINTLLYSQSSNANLFLACGSHRFSDKWLTRTFGCRDFWGNWARCAVSNATAASTWSIWFSYFRISQGSIDVCLRGIKASHCLLLGLGQASNRLALGCDSCRLCLIHLWILQHLLLLGLRDSVSSLVRSAA